MRSIFFSSSIVANLASNRASGSFCVLFFLSASCSFFLRLVLSCCVLFFLSGTGDRHWDGKFRGHLFGLGSVCSDYHGCVVVDGRVGMFFARVAVALGGIHEQILLRRRVRV